MESQVKNATALTTNDVKNFLTSLENYGYKAHLDDTNVPTTKQMTIALPNTSTPFRCLLHFNNQASGVNTLEDGGQIYEIVKNTCRPGQDVDLSLLSNDVKTGGWKMHQKHTYIRTNTEFFQKDLINLATIIAYVKKYRSAYIKNVR